LTYGEERGGIHCQGLCPFDKHAIVGPMGSKFYLAVSQENPWEKALKNSSIQVPISYSLSWSHYVGI